MIDILIPTYGRAERIARVVANVHEATVSQHRVVVIVEESEYASALVALLGSDALLVTNDRAPSYAGAINTAHRTTAGFAEAEYLFMGADDLHFEHGWDTAALALFDGWCGVVGTNDRLNPYVLAGMHSTHSLVARWYLDDIGGVVDEGPGSCLHEGYGHNFVDTEFVATAKARARFRPCLDSVVRHLHQSAGFAPRDATHEKAEATMGADSALYDARRPLWQNLSR